MLIRVPISLVCCVALLSGTAQAAPVLLDVRSRDEYTGNPKEARSGHIPGAQWWSWEQSINMQSGFYLS
jgi:3-mercaptopyruvate sulfurtransferase SseA